MKVIAVSGPRKIDNWQFDQLEYLFQHLEADLFLIGDASGVDQVARHILKPSKIYFVEGNQPKDFAIRTLRMIEDLSTFKDKGYDASLIAFPNKPCPDKTKPSRHPKGEGSGTWLAIAAAKYREIPLDIQPLNKDFDFPYWLVQLTLF